MAIDADVDGIMNGHLEGVLHEVYIRGQLDGIGTGVIKGKLDGKDVDIAFDGNISGKVDATVSMNFIGNANCYIRGNVAAYEK